MKWILGSCIAFWLLFWWAARAADRPGDDFGAAAPAMLCAAVAVALTIVYVALAFWNHRFL